MGEQYLIQHTDQNQLWPGLAVWWAPNRNGYVTDINRAGRYTEVEAREIASNRESDVAVPLDLALSAAMRVVDIHDLRRAIAAKVVVKEVQGG